MCEPTCERGSRGSSAHRRDSGVAMLVTMLVLVLMGWLGIAAMETATRDRQVAGFQNRSRNAFYAAEAGAAQGRSLIQAVSARTDTPALLQTNLGDGAMYNNETQLPQFYGDPAFAPNFIRYTADGAVSGGMNLQTGKPKFVDTLWQINVVGQSPNALGLGAGSTSRVEVVETKILASGY